MAWSSKGVVKRWCDQRAQRRQLLYRSGDDAPPAVPEGGESSVAVSEEDRRHLRKHEDRDLRGTMITQTISNNDDNDDEQEVCLLTKTME